MKGPRPRATSLWGEGFANDTWGDMMLRDRWDSCPEDSYVFAYPNLLPRNGVVPPRVRDRLVSCVAARAWRLFAKGMGTCEMGLRSVSADTVATVGSRDCPFWFAEPEGLLRLLMVLEGRRSLEVEAHEPQLLHMLDAVLAEVEAGRLPAYAPRQALAFSYHSGIHAAYLWPEAVLAGSQMTVAGWLGHLRRGRSALMPLAVAEYLSDAMVKPPCGPARFHDLDLASLIPDPAHANSLWHAARRRNDGDTPIVRLLPPRVATSARGRATASSEGVGS